MKNELDVVRDVSARLDRADIAYMLTGSMAMNYYAEPRMWIVSTEDLILSKLVWARDSHSELQLRDVRNLIASGCDAGYIRLWTGELGVDDLWRECQP